MLSLMMIMVNDNDVNCYQILIYQFNILLKFEYREAKIMGEKFCGIFKERNFAMLTFRLLNYKLFLGILLDGCGITVLIMRISAKLLH